MIQQPALNSPEQPLFCLLQVWPCGSQVAAAVDQTSHNRSVLSPELAYRRQCPATASALYAAVETMQPAARLQLQSIKQATTVLCYFPSTCILHNIPINNSLFAAAARCKTDDPFLSDPLPPLQIHPIQASRRVLQCTSWLLCKEHKIITVNGLASQHAPSNPTHTSCVCQFTYPQHMQPSCSCQEPARRQTQSQQHQPQGTAVTNFLYSVEK